MRRFNYTGRRRISREQISILLRQTSEHGVTAKVELDLEDLKQSGTPLHADVYLEATGGSRFERFPLGTLGLLKREHSLVLEQLKWGETVQFRLKVVDGLAGGRVLAMAARLKPKDARYRSLLPVVIEPLDDLVFKVAFQDDAPPTLVLNQDLDDSVEGGIKAAVAGPLFVSLVFPEVVRQVLTRLLVIDRGEEDEAPEPGTWEQGWLDYARSLVGEQPPSFTGEPDAVAPLIDWIDRVTSAAGKRMGATHKFNELMRSR